MLIDWYWRHGRVHCNQQKLLKFQDGCTVFPSTITFTYISNAFVKFEVYTQHDKRRIWSRIEFLKNECRTTSIDQRILPILCKIVSYRFSIGLKKNFDVKESKMIEPLTLARPFQSSLSLTSLTKKKWTSNRSNCSIDQSTQLFLILSRGLFICLLDRLTSMISDGTLEKIFSKSIEEKFCQSSFFFRIEFDERHLYPNVVAEQRERFERC